MSASEVSPNPFWYAKLTAASTSRDRLSICVLAMFVHKSVDQLSMSRVGKPVKPLQALTLMRGPDGSNGRGSDVAEAMSRFGTGHRGNSLGFSAQSARDGD